MIYHLILSAYYLQGINVVQAACGAEHSIIISDDGRCFAFGWGRAGNLGCGDQDERYS